jgi:diguanylate cyclase (GGDEF)-like protein
MQPKLLLIDDCEQIHRLLDKGLADEGFEHLHAFDADQGFWYAQRALPDVILLDLVMPGRTGLELCQALKQVPAMASTPIIMLTGETDARQKVLALDLGAMDYVTKPFELSELRARVRVAYRTKRMIDLLASSAQIDALTGLHNRHFFDERLKEEVAAARRYGRVVGLILLDIDHFKQCNDTYGHPFGDKVLQHVAATVTSTIRDLDLACRYGGEEFGIIMPHTELDGAVTTAERLRLAFQQLSIRQHGRQVEIRASLGVTSSSQCFALQTLSPAHLVETVDQALYRAKRAGRNCVEVGTRMVSVDEPELEESTTNGPY